MKKQILRFFEIIPAILFSLTSCGNGGKTNSVSSAGGGEPITLKFWHGFTGSDGDYMKTIVDAFNAENEGKITVEVTRLDWDTLFTKFYQNKKNARFSPHIIAVPANRLGSVLAREMVIPMDDVIEELDISSSDFVPSAFEAGIVGGTRYSFPLDIHPTAIFYNKEITGGDLTPYDSWEDFYADCIRFTSNGVYGWAIPNNYSITKDIFYSQLLQNGENILDLSTNDAVFNSEKAVEILNRMYDLKYGESPVSPTNVSNGGDLTLFRAGKSAFYFDGPWMIKTLKESCDFAAYGDLGILPMPDSTGENGISFAGSHQLCLAENTVTTEEIKIASYAFMGYLSENSLEWGKAGQVPARLSVHSQPEYAEIEYLGTFTEMALKAELGKPEYRYFYEMYNYMGTGVSRALNGEGTPKDCLDAQVNNFNRWLKEQ